MPDGVERIGQKVAPASRRRATSQRAKPAFVGWIELCLVLALGLVLARLVLSAVAPLSVPETLPGPAPGARDAGVEAMRSASINPFRQPENQAVAAAIAPANDEVLEETSLDLVLHGVQVDGFGATAVIRTPDGEQRSYAINEEITDGVILDSAREDQVTIRRGGVRETLTMVNRDRKTEAPQPSPITAPAAAAPAAEQIEIGDWTSIVSVTPRPAPGGVELVLAPGAQPLRFEAAGLKAGDVLKSVNGRAIGQTPDSIAEQMQSLEGRDVVDLVVDRDGLQVPVKIFLSTGRGDVNDY